MREGGRWNGGREVRREGGRDGGREGWREGGKEGGRDEEECRVREPEGRKVVGGRREER